MVKTFVAPGRSYARLLPVPSIQACESEMAFRTIVSLKSLAYIAQQIWSCLALLRQEAAWPFSFAFPKAGRSIAARIAMMAITTSSSIRVKPRVVGDRGCVALRKALLADSFFIVHQEHRFLL